MTLKEKFEEIKIAVEDRNLRLKFIDEKNNCISECEEIADDYAIDFAEWVLLEYTENNGEVDSTYELLEIFKREKGL